MKKILFLLLCLGILGYSSMSLNKQTYTYTTEVISEPPGARIEVDGSYLGDAPMTIKWNGYYSRRFHDRFHTIKAYPIQAGHCVQIKLFQGGFEYYPNNNDPIPEKIFFDMSLCRPKPSLDVNINQ